MRLPTALLLVAACSSGGSAAPSATPTQAGPPGPLAPVVGEPSQVTAKVQVGGQPCGVLATATDVWVTDAEQARLVRLDRRRPRVVASTPLDATPCELTAGFGSLWVATQSGVLDRVDPATGRVVARITVGATSYEPLVAFGSVWVSNRGSDTVSRVDPRTNRVTATVATPGVHAGGLVAAGGSVWVGNDTGGATDLTRIDPRTLRLTPASAGVRPGYLAAAAGSVWSSDVGDGTVTRLDARTGARQAVVPLVGLSPVNLSALGGRELWVPDDQGDLLTRIDAVTGTVLERLLVGDGPAVTAQDGDAVWVTHFGDGSVWRVQPGARG